MKTYKTIITILATMLAGASYSHAVAADTGTFGWNNMDTSIDFLISTPGSGGGSFKSVYGGDIQWTAVSTGTSSSLGFGYYVYDSTGALKSTGLTDSISVGSTSTIALDAGDTVSFYLQDGATALNTTGYDNYYGLLGDDTTDFDLKFHSSTWDYSVSPYWDVLVVLNGGTQPSGQPLPGVLSSMLIGLGCLGGYRYFRK